MRFFLALISLILTGCVTTETTGFLDPDYKHYKVEKIVLQINGATLEETQKAEQKLAEEFQKHDIQVIKYTDIAPPTRKYNQKQEANILTQSKAESVFIIYAGQQGRALYQSYVPLTYHPGKTHARVNTIGNTAFVNTYTTPGYTSGGYSVSEPMMTCLVSLIDLRNGNQIWKAESVSSGGGSFTDLIISTGLDSIEDMKKKGMIRK